MLSQASHLEYGKGSAFAFLGLFSNRQDSTTEMLCVHTQVCSTLSGHLQQLLAGLDVMLGHVQPALLWDVVPEKKNQHQMSAHAFGVYAWAQNWTHTSRRALDFICTNQGEPSPVNHSSMWLTARWDGCVAFVLPGPRPFSSKEHRYCCRQKRLRFQRSNFSTGGVSKARSVNN